MTDLTLNSLVGGSSFLKLAPDVGGYISQTDSSISEKILISGIDGSSGLTTAVSLTGKYAISYLRFSALSNESTTVKMTVDGEVIYNDTRSTIASNQWFIFGGESESLPFFTCDSSFLLEIQTTSDSSVNLFYSARPIL